MARPLTRLEATALAALQAGDLGPVIQLLLLKRDRLHPRLQQELADMMLGNGNTEYSLCAKMRSRKQLEIIKERRTARVVRAHLDGKRGQKTKRAYPDAAAELGINERTVRRHFNNRERAFRRFLRAHGLWPRTP